MRRRSDTEAGISTMLDDAERLGMCMTLPRGWERGALAQRLAAGELVRPMPGMYARASSWEGLSRREKLLHVVKTESVFHSTWVFSHATAALVHGLEVSDSLVWPITYTTARSGGGKSSEHYRHHRRDGVVAVRVGDIRVTDVAQTVADCACAYEFGQALAIADSALHQGLVEKDELVCAVGGLRHVRGVEGARRVVDLADPRPESGGESRVRALMLELGLPEPELQARFADPERPGHFFRVDFLYRPEGLPPVALELDGMDKYEDIRMTHGESAVRVMARERQREALLTASGLRVARLGFADALRPEVLLARLAVYGVTPVAG